MSPFSTPRAHPSMSDSPLDLDLKFLPDWLKESDTKNPYADYAGEAPRRDFDRRGGDRGRGPARGPGGRGPGGPGQGSRGPQGRTGSRDDRGPRRDFSGSPRGLSECAAIKCPSILGCAF